MDEIVFRRLILAIVWFRLATPFLSRFRFLCRLTFFCESTGPPNRLTNCSPVLLFSGGKKLGFYRAKEWKNSEGAKIRSPCSSFVPIEPFLVIVFRSNNDAIKGAESIYLTFLQPSVQELLRTSLRGIKKSFETCAEQNCLPNDA